MHRPFSRLRGMMTRPLLVGLGLSLFLGSVSGASLLMSPDKKVRTMRPGSAPPLAEEDAHGSCPDDGKHGDHADHEGHDHATDDPKPGEKPEEKPDEKKEEKKEIPESGDSEGCVSCHEGTEVSHAEDIGATCVGCHGGDGKAKDAFKGHVQPRFPELWGWKKGKTGNPERIYAMMNREKPEFIRFINPGDNRVSHLSCGPCHEQEVLQVRKSMMTHGGMLYGAALYNNGVLPFKDPVLGESYSYHGDPQVLQGVPQPTEEETLKRGRLPFLFALPRWEVSQMGNLFRVFERGGFKKGEIGNPTREEEPGRPDTKLSARGHGTGLRTDSIVLGAQKTRLLDPTLNFLGTNDQPGDYRSSGCTSCHNVYANDRDEVHSAQYAKFGHLGQTQTEDPMLGKAKDEGERGHPITHKMTLNIPTSQCMTCHMHPGTNMLTTYLGLTWWDNETDGELFYPKKPLERSASERDRIQNRNPEGAAVKGLWGDPKFLENVRDLNPKMKHTQVADFNGHGWIYRGVYKQDRKGNHLDKDGKKIDFNDPDKWNKSVHLKDIHLEKGMHCVDCHFQQDTHGDTHLYNEPRAAIEITCQDCHGSVNKKADPTDENHLTTGLAGGNALKKYNTIKWGIDATERWYKKDDGRIFQRSAVKEGTEWELVQVRDTITPGNPRYNEKSRLAKTIRKDGKTWGSTPTSQSELAHNDDNMNCYTCHTSWTTSCFGCHLQMTANQKKPQLHYEGGDSRNWTSYNFQTLRDDMYMLGKDGSVTGNKTAPIRSSCAVMVSSQNQNREWLYYQQQATSAEGMAGTAFSSYVPHTVRGKETKQCTDCHLSKAGDNNAWMSNLLLQGSNAVNFVGRNAWVGTGHGFEAIRVSERDEPAAVIGSSLHKLAYPLKYESHQGRGRKLADAHGHEGETLNLQLRGEYLYCADGAKGLRIYDVANIENKGFSERITSAPVSPLGQKLYVNTKHATDVATPSTMPMDPERQKMPRNQEQAIHPLYGYCFVTDSEEGLIAVKTATLMDGNPTNNFLKRAMTWNPNGILKGAHSIEIAGTHAYITCHRGLVVVNIDDPLHPRVAAEIGEPALKHPTSVAVQFRYAFVTDADGLKTLDVTFPDKPKVVPNALVRFGDARSVYVSRTYAYVAAGAGGLAIVDVEKPEAPVLEQTFTADGKINDANQVVVGMTNNSTFAYVADGKNGLRVVQLTSPEWTPGIYGYAPKASPQLIASYKTEHEALAISEGLDRDRAVDESGNQLSVFGRRGARPFNREEAQRMYLQNGQVYTVSDEPPGPATEEPASASARVSEDRQFLASWTPALALLIPPGLFLWMRRRKAKAA